MKRCPECRRDYYDDTLLYCLDDGSALLEGPASGSESATAILHSTGQVSEAATRAQAHPATQSETRGFDKRLLVGAIIVAVVVLGGVFGYRYFSSASSKQIDSIAVMPFVNESGSADAEYLSDGMTETLISSLSQLPNLNVKARSSVFRYKGKETSAQTIGKELDVQAILTGRVVQRGNDLALYVELADAATEIVLWKADYNRPMTNLVALQTEIARDVSNKLRTRLSGAEQQQVAKSFTENAEAYRLYLQGRYHWNKRKPEEHLKAIQYFEQAIALDPKYALAYAGLADCYAVSSAPIEGPEKIAKLRSAANKALELDPSLGEPHAALASVYWEEYDWAGAEREFKTAIELNPHYPTAHQWYGELLTRLGRHDEAIAEINRARELDPLSLVINSDMIYMLSMARRYDEAIEQAKKTLEMDISWNLARYELIAAYLHKGSYEEALAEEEKALEYSDRTPERKASVMQEIAKMREAYRRSGAEGYWSTWLEFEKQDIAKGDEASPIFMAEIHANLGDRDEALRWLEKAVSARDSETSLLKVYPAFDRLRDDPRFKALLKRLNLPEGTVYE